jgi:hypothetical protein
MGDVTKATIPYLDGPHLSKPVKATVTTRFSEARIEQTLNLSGIPDYTTRIVDLQEAGTREALVKMGWTPPDGDAFQRGVKAGLEAAAEALTKRRAKADHSPIVQGIDLAVEIIDTIDPATIKPVKEG